MIVYADTQYFNLSKIPSLMLGFKSQPTAWDGVLNSKYDTQKLVHMRN